LTVRRGLNAYEVSNHAAPGFESKHNLIYWRYEDYVGIEPGAHGRLTINGDRLATKAPDRPEAYLNGAAGEIEKLGDEAQLIERLSMGLRLAEGTPLYADDYFYADDKRVAKLEQLISDGLLRHDCGTLRATQKGRPVLNRLLYEVLG
jgi:oxygen-independent coproporphyrinogen-3 oxidase